MRKKPMKLRTVTALWVGVLALAACGDDGPEGPGELAATLGGPTPVGAAVVEVRGTGVTGFEGAGSTRTFSGSPSAGVHRVVLVATTPGDLHFRIRVQDRQSDAPSVTVVSAVDAQNAPLSSVAAYSVKVTR